MFFLLIAREEHTSFLQFFLGNYLVNCECSMCPNSSLYIVMNWFSVLLAVATCPFTCSSIGRSGLSYFILLVSSEPALTSYSLYSLSPIFTSCRDSYSSSARRVCCIVLYIFFTRSPLISILLIGNNLLCVWWFPSIVSVSDRKVTRWLKVKIDVTSDVTSILTLTYDFDLGEKKTWRLGWLSV